MADVQIAPTVVKERSVATAHTITYASPPVRPTEKGMGRFNTYSVDEYLDVRGRLVQAADVPITVAIDVYLPDGGDVSIIAQPWSPVDFIYQYPPVARWVADPVYVEETSGLVSKWHSMDGSPLLRAFHPVTGATTMLHTANVQVPMYSYWSGKRWLTCDAVSVGTDSEIHVDLDDVAGGSAFMAIGTFDKAAAEQYRLMALDFGIDELWFGVDNNDSCTIRLNTDQLLSLPFPYAPGRLMGILLVDAPDGITAVLRTIDGVQRSGTTRGITSEEIGPTNAVLYGTGTGDSEFVEAALWLGGPDLTMLKQQLSSLMSYYATRVR